ncbi:hypothetical protein [Bremerella alba]|uniref:hypothetical protein n=1 Tax=Bremerella alba TaxID=980252 RepID=UPI001A954B12|nr:hypothetical protein [Bremerella alba]
MDPYQRHQRFHCIWQLLLIAAAGCGAAQSDTYRVSGQVNFDGQPVPAGTILFQPDKSQGASGQAGLAIIRDGQFDTAAEGGRGTSGGAQRVRIIGLDGKPVEMGPNGVPLFSDHTEKVSLPQADSTHNFDIPKRTRRR